MSRKISTLFILTILFSISGCSYFAEKISSLSDTTSVELNKFRSFNKSAQQCLPEDKVAISIEDENVAKFLKNEYKKLFLNPQYTFVQKAVFLSLIEIARRPDAAGFNSRFQAVVKFNNKFYYFDNETIPKEKNEKNIYFNSSFYIGLNDILKIQHRDETLLKIAKTLDSSIGLYLPVSNDFESFLSKHKKTIAKNPSLAEVFLKGEETVTRFESFPRNSFTQLVQTFENQFKSSSPEVNSFKELSYPIEGKSSSTIACNKVLEDSLSEVIDFEKVKTHHFSLREGENFFIGITSSIIQEDIKTMNDKLYQLNNKPNPYPLPICLFKNQTKEILLASIDGRNPHQHLKHLINYEIDQVDNFLELSDVLNFSRHLFLSNPDRILYESKKGRKSQLDFFLSKKFPIYHVEDLGQIVGYSMFDKKNNLILDSRNATVLWCHK